MNKSGQETLSKQLLNLRVKTSWSWPRIYHEFYRVMGHKGPSHTTLFKYASEKSQADQRRHRALCQEGESEAHR